MEAKDGIRVAVVTGGIGGIGTAICVRLAMDRGRRVLANCLPGDPQRVAWVAARRDEGFANIDAIEADVSDFGACRDMVASIERDGGHVDILVNNAGIIRDNRLRRLEPEDWSAVIRANLDSVYNATKNVIDGMVERGWGRIVNMSSVNGQKGQAGQTNYAAAKAGLHGFAKSLAQEVVRNGVTVNSVSPGYVDTGLLKSLRQDVMDRILASIPIGRLARPEEIAGLVAYLCSEEAGYITGTNIAINGGMYMT